MELYTKSREAAEAGNDLDKPHVIISINFPKDWEDDAQPVTNDNTKEILRLYFSDVGRASNPVPRRKNLKRCQIASRLTKVWPARSSS